MISLIRLYLIAFKIAASERMAYRFDFFISSIMMLIFEFIFPLVTILIYRTGSSFPGWSLYEVLLIQGIFLMSKGVASPLFFGMVWITLDRVREGTFDFLLIRPRSVLFMTIITGIDIEDLGKLAGGISLFYISLMHLPAPGLEQCFKFILLFGLSVAVLFSCALFMSGSVFKWVGNSRVYEIFDSIAAFGMYPLSIFSKPIQALLALLLPMAMVGFFPASVLLGKPTTGIIYSSIVCILFLIAGLWFWHMMLSRYTSAGG